MSQSLGHFAVQNTSKGKKQKPTPFHQFGMLPQQAWASGDALQEQEVIAIDSDSCASRSQSKLSLSMAASWARVSGGGTRGSKASSGMVQSASSP